MRATALLLTAVAFTCPAIQAADDAAPERPAVPPLVAGDDLPDAPKSFLVDGAYRSLHSDGLGFRFAKDETREFCGVYDATDGTPIFLSDGRQTLVYDLGGSRVVLLPRSCAVVTIDSVPGYGWMVFTKITFNRNPGRAPKQESRFRIDSFLTDFGATAEEREDPNHTRVFAFKGLTGASATLRLHSNDDSRFECTSYRSGDAFVRLEVEATRIGQTVPADVFTFPDVMALAADVPVTRLEDDFFVKLGFLEAQGGMHKLMMTFRSVEPPSEGNAYPTLDQLRLQIRDADLGSRYRAALARQGFWFGTNGWPPAAMPRPPVVAEKPGSNRPASTFVSNQRLAEAVAAALRLVRLRGADLEIFTEAGVVQLEGRVPDEAARELADRTVQSVDGVLEVDNRLRVIDTSSAPPRPPVMAEKPAAARH